jgi:dsDNA-specific endonuclease/ATPase MutS2
MSIQLTKEEEKLILEKRQLEQQLKENSEKQKELNSIKFKELEKEFKIAYDKANEEVEKCILSAKKELKKIENISEKYGVPIDSPIVDIGKTRNYTPKSFFEKWANHLENLDDDMYDNFIEEYELYNSSESGWQYWSISSLSC